MDREKFKTDNAYHIYALYLNKIKHITEHLPKFEVENIIMEIDSHIFEYLSSGEDSDYNEEDRLKKILNKLGEPDSYLRPLVADLELKYAVQKYNIISILKAVYNVIKVGGTYLLLSLLYLFILVLGILLIAKLFYPSNIGLFYEKGRFVGLGFLAHVNEQMTEQLGYWFILVMIIVIIIFYIVITYLFKNIISRKSKKGKESIKKL